MKKSLSPVMVAIVIVAVLAVVGVIYMKSGNGGGLDPKAKEYWSKRFPAPGTGAPAPAPVTPK
jgi:ABC-type cobalt transport system substrate-binding protein